MNQEATKARESEMVSLLLQIQKETTRNRTLIERVYYLKARIKGHDKEEQPEKPLKEEPSNHLGFIENLLQDISHNNDDLTILLDQLEGLI